MNVTPSLVYYRDHDVMMNTRIILFGAVGILVILCGFWFWSSRRVELPPSPVVTNPVATTTLDYKSATYLVEGQPVTLINGVAETQISTSSASSIETEYFGNEATGDLNGDGVPDVAFILTQNAGGSGVFYYVVAALKTPSGYQGTNALLLGDRIAPQSTTIQNGTILVTYATRRPSDPMTAEPSIGVSKLFRINGANLVELAAPTP